MQKLIIENGIKKYIDLSPDELLEIEAKQLSQAAAELPNAKTAALDKILELLAAFPGQVFGATPEKLVIYERKQQLVNSWAGEDIPPKPQIEWGGDWSQRADFTTNGWVVVEAAGVSFKCSTAVDLWQTWRLNTALANYLDEQSEPLRTRAQADIQAAVSGADVESIVTGFKDSIEALPGMFIANVLPGLVSESGLTVA